MKNKYLTPEVEIEVVSLNELVVASGTFDTSRNGDNLAEEEPS